MLNTLQKNFYQAIIQPPEQADQAILDQLQQDQRIDKKDRLNIYRINVMASLITNLEAVYPMVSLMAKPENFRYAASLYIRNNLPTVPQLSAYGKGFASFLENFKPAQSQPIIAEMAKLEWLRNEALFAADKESLTLQDFQDIAIEDYPCLKFQIHPSIRLLYSPYPLNKIWHAYQEDPSFKLTSIDLQDASYIMIFRPAWKVEQKELSIGDYAFIKTLTLGENLESAAEQALTQENTLNFQQVLSNHLTLGTFTDILK